MTATYWFAPSKTPMHLFLDTEFKGFGGDLISAALVSPEGHEWYSVLPCLYPRKWVKKHVIPVLNASPSQREFVMASLHAFLMQFPKMHVVADWPEDIQHFCSLLTVGDGVRLATPPITFELITPSAPLVSLTPHNALSDARALCARAGPKAETRT